MAQQFTYMAMQMQLEEVLYKQKKLKYFLNPLPVYVRAAWVKLWDARKIITEVQYLGRCPYKDEQIRNYMIRRQHHNLQVNEIIRVKWGEWQNVDWVDG